MTLYHCPVLAAGQIRRPESIEDLIGAELMARLDRLDFRSRKVFEGVLQGERRSKRRGRSVEFADFRPYAHGDDLRHIDWNVYARFERLFIKLFVAEEDLAVHVAVDRSASMNAGSPNKLIFAQKLAMALGYVGLIKNNRVVVSAFGRRSFDRLDPMRGRRNAQRLGEFILRVMRPEPGVGASERVERAGANRSFAECMRAVAMGSSGSGVVVVISDFLYPEGVESGLNALGGRRGIDAQLIQTLAPDELHPERIPGGGVAGDVRLLDVETGAAVEATVSDALIAQHSARLGRFCAALDKAAAARGIRCLLAPTDAPVETLVLETLRRRGLVG